jgi:hypothetical protein
MLRAVYGNAAPDPPVPIEIRPGETTFAEARFAAGRTVVFDFQVPEGERLPRSIGLEVRDAAGALAFEQDPFWPQSIGDREVLTASSALPLGAFQFAVRSEEGWSASGSLEVVAGPELQLRVTIPLVRER